MPLERLMLIIVCVVAAAAATVWLAVALFADTMLSPITGLGMISVVALCAYVAVRMMIARANKAGRRSR